MGWIYRDLGAEMENLIRSNVIFFVLISVYLVNVLVLVFLTRSIDSDSQNDMTVPPTGDTRLCTIPVWVKPKEELLLLGEKK